MCVKSNLANDSSGRAQTAAMSFLRTSQCALAPATRLFQFNGHKFNLSANALTDFAPFHRSPIPLYVGTYLPIHITRPRRPPQSMKKFLKPPFSLQICQSSPTSTITVPTLCSNTYDLRPTTPPPARLCFLLSCFVETCTFQNIRLEKINTCRPGPITSSSSYYLPMKLLHKPTSASTILKNTHFSIPQQHTQPVNNNTPSVSNQCPTHSLLITTNNIQNHKPQSTKTNTTYNVEIYLDQKNHAHTQPYKPTITYSRTRPT